MRTHKKQLRQVAVLFSTVCCLAICLFLTALSAKPCIAMTKTYPVVIAETDTLSRVGGVVKDKVIDKVLGVAKDAVDLGKAVFESDVANPEGSQPVSGENVDAFRARTGRDKADSGSSSGGGRNDNSEGTGRGRHG